VSEPIVITLVPVREANGYLRDLWDAEVNGEVLVRRSAAAVRDVARLLLRQGADPSAALTVKYYADDSGAHLTTTLRAAAELSPMGKVA
jgi:hypothetical protein